MRTVLLLLVMLAGCTEGPLAPRMTPPPPETPIVRLPADNEGVWAQKAHAWCTNGAQRRCPQTHTIRCEAYIRSYTKSCMVGLNVDPGYILIYTQ